MVSGRNCLLGWPIVLAFAGACRQASEIPKPEPAPITELEAKIRTIEGLRVLAKEGATERDRAVAEATLLYWTRRFDEETGKVTEPASHYPGPLETTEDYVRQAYWVHLQGIEGYENLMLTDPTFGPSPEARKGIALRREECHRVLRNLSRPKGAPVPKEVFDYEGEILRKRKLLLEKGPASWQKPLLEEMVRWWEEFGKALAEP